VNTNRKMVVDHHQAGLSEPTPARNTSPSSADGSAALDDFRAGIFFIGNRCDWLRRLVRRQSHEAFVVGTLLVVFVQATLTWWPDR